jgi:hypothetical protein
MTSYAIRNATEADLDEILKVEASWPEQARAPREKFVARLRKFPQGFFLVEHEGAAVATITACPHRYEPARPQAMHSWDRVTNQGFLHDIGPLTDYNALYIVSGVIATAHRGRDVFELAVRREVTLAQELGLAYVVAGAVIPGYAHYCATHGEIPAREYALLRRGTHLVDPLLDMYQRIGFKVPDSDHVIAEYFPDDASLNHGAVVVLRINDS